MTRLEVRQDSGDLFATALTGDEFRESSENPKAEQLVALVGADDLTRAIADLYDFARKEVRSGRLTELDRLVTALEDSIDRSAEFAIAVLTATLPVKSRLSARTQYLTQLQHHLRELGEDPELVLRGLD